MDRYVLHVIPSHVSNAYMYNQIVGVKRYRPVVYGGYALKHFPFRRFIRRTNYQADLRRIFRQHPIRLIHAHFGSLGAKVIGHAKRYRVPVVTHFRGGDASNHFVVRETLRRKYAQLSKEGALFLPVCEAQVPMLEDLDFPRERIKVLYGGIDLGRFPFLERNYAEDSFRLCFVGKTAPKKGLPVLVDAFALLAKEFPGIKLSIVSTSPRNETDALELRKLKVQIAEYGIGDQVRFRFDVKNDDLYQELHRAHVFCHPSRTFEGNIEGIPNALKEAMATGLPCVSTHHAGIPELIQTGYNGLLVEENDVPALRDAIAQLITHPSWCKDFGLRARQKVEANFDLEKQLTVQRKLYDSLFC